MGSFYTTVMGEFVHMDLVESDFDDDAREIQRIWDIDEEELIEWRGFLDLPPRRVAPTEPQPHVQTVVYQKPKMTLDGLKRGLIQFAEAWVSRW